MAGAVRQPIDVSALERYISQNVPVIKVPLGVKQFGFGQSNPTYLLTDSNGERFVMRKKPPGKLLSKTAHRVEREYRIIHALEQTDVPVPKAICLCEDHHVIGTAFYIMEFLDGRIFIDPAFPDVSAGERSELWHDAIRTLAKFHRIKPKSIGMEDFGRSSGFYDRQIVTFKTISETQAQAIDADTKIPVGELPGFDEMVEFFGNKTPQPEDRATFVHGDYKIDNLVFHKTEPRVIGVLDWEMATIGHPLSDLCNLTAPFVNAATAPISAGAFGLLPGAIEGLPSREDCIRWYSEVAGWDPRPHLPWGDAFYMFRASIFMQGIAARHALRQASSERASDYGKMMRPFALSAWENVKKMKEEIRQNAKL